MKRKKYKKQKHKQWLGYGFCSALLLGHMGCTFAAQKHTAKPSHTPSHPPHTRRQHYSFDINVAGLAPISKAQLVQDLGWVAVPGSNICGGYYEEPLLNPLHQVVIPLQQSRTVINSGGVTYTKKGTSYLNNGVVITQAGRKLTSDSAYLYRDPQTQQTTAIELVGNVHIREQGKLLIGSRAHIVLHKHAGTIHNVVYRMAAKTSIQHIIHKHGFVHVAFTDLNAWGRALEVKQLKKGLYHFLHATYSTCTPDNTVWQVYTHKLILNQATGYGQAYGAVLYIKGVPLAYLPYISFPINHKRKTGFLAPQFGHDNRSGYYFGLPFYWNIAPNYDDTITPLYFSRRGGQISNLFRFLLPHSRGKIYASFLPDDREFRAFRDDAMLSQFLTPNVPLNSTVEEFNRLKRDSTNRAFISAHDTTIFNKYLSAGINYNYASDDYYFEDFGHYKGIPIDQLHRESYFHFNSQYVHVSGLFQTYQTLHPVDQPLLASPYGKEPQIQFSANSPITDGFEFGVTGQFDDFVHNRTPGESKVVIGHRYDVRPAISYPFKDKNFFITPRAQVDLAEYKLGQDKTFLQNNSGFVGDPSRAVPMIDVLTGMTFSRNVDIFHHDYVQTLEPEVYYLYVPFRSQRNMPLFDTTQPALTVADMLSDNRFSGLDRVGDANQVTFALTTRLLDAHNHQQRFQAQVAQIYYFENRRVELCDTVNCKQSLSSLPQNTSSSPIVGSLSYELDPSWSIHGNLSWQLGHSTPFAQGVMFHYEPDPEHIFNIGYSFSQFQVPETVGGVDVSRANQYLGNEPRVGTLSFLWPAPFIQNLSFVGFANYDFNSKRLLSNFAGLQYNSCCWSFRVVFSRTFNFMNAINNNNVYNQTIYFQVVLKGLGQVYTSDPASLLTTNINGYQDNTLIEMPRFV